MDLLNESLMDSSYRLYDKRRNFDGYSNFTTYPIYNVRAKHAVTINNGVNPPMNILAGQSGTFQQLAGAPIANSNSYLAEIIFGGNKIHLQFNSNPNNPNAVRDLLIKNSYDFDIISVVSDSKRGTKTNYSNITRTVSETMPVKDLTATEVTLSTAPTATTTETVVPPRVVEATTPVPTNPINPINPINPSTPVFIATSTSLPNPSNPNSPTTATILTPLPTPTATSMSSPVPVSAPVVPMGGGGGTAPAPTDGGGGSGAREGDILGSKVLECKSNYWILGLALGAIGGYVYAKTKKKEVLKNVLLISALGGAVGYGVDLIVCKKKKIVVPATTPTTEPAK